MDGDQSLGPWEEVFVSHVEDAVTFWGQSLPRGYEICELVEELAQICPMMSAVFGNPDPGRMYGGLFSHDNTWYRCRVQTVIDDEKCQVTYIDYGNSEVLSRSNIVDLPDELQRPSFAQKYRLWGLQLFDSDVSLSQSGTEFLISMINEKQVTVRRKAIYRDNTIVVQAEHSNVDIGEEVLKRGFALLCKHAANCNSIEDRKLQSKCSHSKPQVLSPLRNRQVERSTADYQNSLSAQPRKHSHLNIQKPSPNRNENNSGNIKTSTKLAHEFTRCSVIVKNSELMLIEENKKLKHEIDLKIKKCQSLESKIELLHFTAEKEKEIEKETCNNLEKKLQTAVADKLGSLSAKVLLLKEARRQNMNIRIGDNISEAIRIVSEESITEPPSLQKLEAVWKEYDHAQGRIQLCKDKAEVDDLIGKRNEVKQHLFSAVQEFIMEVNIFTIAERTKALQRLSSSLEAEYGEATSVDSSHTVFREFYEWKDAQFDNFCRVRIDTDKSLQALFLWFRDLREFFDLTSSVSISSEEVVGDIDGVLKKVEATVDKELDMTVAGQNESDKKIIICAYNKVIEKIYEELQLINLVLSKHTASLEFKEQNSEWLHKSPNIDKLLGIKKTLKGLKTDLKLRLIEQRNLEDTDEDSDPDVMTIKGQLTELRDKIFEEIYCEQAECEKLSCLVKKWFPELPLLYPEAGLLPYMNSSRLISASLEREILDAKPLKELSSKRPVVCASVQGQKVLLKGYSVGVDTETQLIERAAKYHMAWSELKEESGLLKLLFIFFCKSDPLAYLMVPFYCGESLGEVQATIPLTSEEVVKVMKGVACGLQTLHKSNIVHGSVHQNNVFTLDRKKGILADFDFTKTEEQRNLLNSVGYLTLTAPEVKDGCLASPSSDMYSYGGLLLWIFHGESWKMKPDRTPDLDAFHMSGNLKTLLSRLLSPDDRLTATQVIADEYFQVQEAQIVPVAPNTGKE